MIEAVIALALMQLCAAALVAVGLLLVKVLR